MDRGGALKRLFSGILLLLAGCAARVPVQVPAAPSVQMSHRALAVVAVDRSCRDIADHLADHLGTLEGFRVHPDAPARLNLYACNRGFWTTGDSVEGRAVAIGALSTDDGVIAHLLGAARKRARADDAEASDGPVPFKSRALDSLDREVARDLSEQIAPVPTRVHRRVYANTTADSARHYHNLAVAAEADGRVDDALWWAQRAWERRPTPRRARYVAELTRRLSRTEPGPSQILSELQLDD